MDPTQHTGHPPEIRDLTVLDAARTLRIAFGYEAPDPPYADVPEHVPAAYAGRVDMHGWIAWALAGLPLFSDRQPTYAQATKTARRLIIVWAMRCAAGTILHAAHRIRTSPRVIRGALRALGLYPWTRAPERTSMPRFGARVVALAREESRDVYVYGRGVFVGTSRPPVGTRTRRFGIVTAEWTLLSPCIVLDGARGSVWGVQCEWMPEKEFEKRHGDKAIHLVPIPSLGGPTVGSTA